VRLTIDGTVVLAGLQDIHSVHYTMCRKPWGCQAKGVPGGHRLFAPNSAIDIDMVNLDHCLALQKQWHDLRSDFERKLFALTGDAQIRTATTGRYRPDVFNGHCNGDGGKHYKLISAAPETFRRVRELYDVGMTTPPIGSRSSTNFTIA
jgi:hypothetical protein